MDAKQLGNMLMFVVGFLLLWAAMRMGWVLARPIVADKVPAVASATDFILL